MPDWLLAASEQAHHSGDEERLDAYEQFEEAIGHYFYADDTTLTWLVEEMQVQGMLKL